MPVRHALRALALALVLGAAACSSDNGPTTDTLVTQTTDLFPSGATGTQATTLAAEVVTAANAGDAATARAQAFTLTELTLNEFAAGHLSGPANTLPDRLDTYITHIFSKASLGTPPLHASSFGPEGIVSVVQPAGGIFVNSTLRAGISIPNGALTEPTLLVADRLPDAYAPGSGPLPTNNVQYPLYYEFTTTPETTFSADAILGICQVTDPSSAYYAPDSAYARLQLAHPNPADRTTIELLERVDPTFLNCTNTTTDAIRTGASIAALTSRAGGIGGRVRKFSPFGAVDPEQLKPGALAGIYVTNAGNNSVLVFALDATGDVAPARTITGSNTGLNLPIGIGADGSGNLLVANRKAGTVTVFPATGNGNIAPTRVLTATGMGSPEGLVVASSGEVFVSACPNCGSANGGSSAVFHFPLSANTSDYSIGGTNTGFTYPGSIAIDGTGNIVVANSFGGTVAVFAPGTNGDVAPVRTFTPPSANIQSMSVGGNTIALSVPSAGVELFPLTASGATTPTATIGAPDVPITYPGGVFIDASVLKCVRLYACHPQPVIYLTDYSSNRIYVITTAGVTPNLTFAGLTTISGATTGLNGPVGITVMR